MTPPPSLVPLGDQAVLAYFGDERAAWHFAAAVRRSGGHWLVDVAQVYASVAVFFDLAQMNFAAVAEHLRSLPSEFSGSAEVGRLRLIPCCYELGPDLLRVAEHTGLAVEEVIRQHAGTDYTVYAIGFCPGFPYLGYLPPALSGVPRLPQPRLRVAEGSVGLTGRQTGIYTEVRPGGWNLIARTPLQLVDVRENYFPLRTGDRVRFQSISEEEYHRLRGQRLSPEE